MTIENGNGNGGVSASTMAYAFGTGNHYKYDGVHEEAITDFVNPVGPGGTPLTEVDDHGVVAGPDRHLVAVAHPSALHAGGQPVVTGGGTVFVGVDQSPLARAGDRTADGGMIVDQTDEHVYAG